MSYVAGRRAVRAVLDTFFIGTSVEILSKSYEFMTLRFSCAASSPNVTAGHDWLRARGKTGGTNFQRPVRWSGDGDVADLKVLLLPMVPLVCVYNTMSRQNSDSVHTVRLRSTTSQYDFAETLAPWPLTCRSHTLRTLRH